MANPKDLTIQIPAPNIQEAKFTIIGTANLIFHKWDEKAKRMILDKQMKKAVKAREVRNPEAEYEASFYKDEKGNIVFPATAIKQAIVDSVRNIPTVTMALVRGALFVNKGEEFIPVKYGEKSMREDMVRVGMGTADLRYRGQLKDWSMELKITYNADLVSVEQVASLIQYAGFSCGIGEWRPQRNGDFGTFELKK